LDRVSEDLTWLAKRGMIDFCVGRDEIIKSILRIIEGGGRGAVLTGEHGVGKTAIVERMAELMIKEEVPKILQDKRLVSVSLSEIMGGATSEEAGAKLKAAIEDAMRAGNIVLDIANLEYFAAEGASSLAALLADMLARYRLPVLASTTPEGYKQVVEGTALAGIFERVDVPEPEENLAIQILEAESGGIEYKTGVYFSYDAIAGAVKLSERYLHDRYLPDKAREIMKEAAMYVQGKRGKKSIVSYEDIAKVVSEKGKVPVTSITESEREKLLKLEEVIHERIIGQAEAVDMVSAALRRAGAGMHEGKRPIANFLFLGPTGVGKTELAKTIAQVFFGGENEMIRVDMSEYQEKQGLQRMIGAAGEDGLLTEEVRRKPFALLLLDEVEKAHPDILNLFLQVMDDGRLTDGKGHTIDFTNLIIVATSNAGSDFIAKEVDKKIPIEDIKKALLEEKLGAYFKPEFLNRFDGVIVFRPLASDEIVKIAELLIKKIARKMADKGIELIVEAPALQELARQGFDPKFGARPLRRVLAKEVEDRLANMILQGKVKRRDRVVFNTLQDIQVLSAKKL
jgi:ATP-dependent Clp protease ATP-binding subunit ClpC